MWTGQLCQHIQGVKHFKKAIQLENSLGRGNEHEQRLQILICEINAAA